MKTKFRAWDIRKNVMREVVVLHFNEASNISGASYWSEDMELKSLHGKYIKLMQYTGLNDSNGVEIYEGDVLDYGDYSNSHEVIFKNGTFWGHAIGYGEYIGIGLYNALEDLKVIGNIYQHKELLEGE